MPTPQSPFWGRPCKARRPGACKPAVIANQCLAPAHTSFLQHVIASQCAHLWQSVLPAEMPGKLALLRANSQPLSYLPKVLLSAMPCRRSTDCHVASLLAMTVGTSLHSLTPVRLQHVIANQCAHWCGNPFSPQRNLATWQQFGRIRDALRICLRHYFLLCTAARSTDCHVASLLAMTC